MVLESTMVCVDNSEYMRNGDFVPTRLQAQQDAVNIVCHSKTRANPENNVGLITMANTEVLVTLTTDVGKILAKLHQVNPNGDSNFLSAIRVAHLTLKHRQGRNHRMRIVAFVGSPLPFDEKDLVRLAKRLKKEKVQVDVISFGEESENTTSLTTFINTLNGKDGSGSHLVTVPPGPHLSDALISSPVVQGEDGTGAPTQGFEFGVDPNEDPELALALRVSMEEQRQRQEDESRRVQQESANEGGTPAPAAQSESTTEEALLKQALAMSMGGGETAETTETKSAPPAMPDFTQMSEDEQIAYAMRMSMQDAHCKTKMAASFMKASNADFEQIEKLKNKFNEIVNESNDDDGYKQFCLYNEGSTRMMYEAFRGREDRVRELIKKGCSVNEKNVKGWTSVMIACGTGHDGCVRALIEADCDIEVTEKYGRAALIGTSVFGWGECMRLLIEAKCKLDAQDIDGLTALSWACRYGQDGRVQQLIEANCLTDIKDKRGRTPLMYASMKGNVRCVEYLLNVHADVMAEDNDGHTAVSLAAAAGHLDVVEALYRSNHEVVKVKEEQIIWALSKDNFKDATRAEGGTYCLNACLDKQVDNFKSLIADPGHLGEDLNARDAGRGGALYYTLRLEEDLTDVIFKKIQEIVELLFSSEDFKLEDAYDRITKETDICKALQEVDNEELIRWVIRRTHEHYKEVDGQGNEASAVVRQATDTESCDRENEASAVGRSAADTEPCDQENETSVMIRSTKENMLKRRRKNLLAIIVKEELILHLNDDNKERMKEIAKCTRRYLGGGNFTAEVLSEVDEAVSKETDNKEIEQVICEPTNIEEESGSRCRDACSCSSLSICFKGTCSQLSSCCSRVKQSLVSGLNCFKELSCVSSLLQYVRERPWIMLMVTMFCIPTIPYYVDLVLDILSAYEVQKTAGSKSTVSIVSWMFALFPHLIITCLLVYRIQRFFFLGTHPVVQTYLFLTIRLLRGYFVRNWSWFCLFVVVSIFQLWPLAAYGFLGMMVLTYWKLLGHPNKREMLKSEMQYIKGRLNLVSELNGSVEATGQLLITLYVIVSFSSDWSWVTYAKLITTPIFAAIPMLVSEKVFESPTNVGWKGSLLLFFIFLIRYTARFCLIFLSLFELSYFFAFPLVCTMVLVVAIRLLEALDKDNEMQVSKAVMSTKLFTSFLHYTPDRASDSNSRVRCRIRFPVGVALIDCATLVVAASLGFSHPFCWYFVPVIPLCHTASLVCYLVYLKKLHPWRWLLKW